MHPKKPSYCRGLRRHKHGTDELMWAVALFRGKHTADTSWRYPTGFGYVPRGKEMVAMKEDGFGASTSTWILVSLTDMRES